MIPDYQTIMLPLLQYTADGDTHRLLDVVDGLADQIKLSEEERKEMLPSGYSPVFSNRVGWASTYLKKAGLLTSEKRGTMVITERGKQVLSEKPDRIDIAFLDQFPEFLAFRKGKKTEKEKDIQPEQADEQTPEEMLEYAHEKLQDELTQELLAAVMDASPQFF